MALHLGGDLVRALAALLLLQLPAQEPGKAVKRGPGAWTPGTRVGDQDGTPGSWLQPGPILAFADIWRVYQQRKGINIFLFISLLPITVPLK